MPSLLRREYNCSLHRSSEIITTCSTSMRLYGSRRRRSVAACGLLSCFPLLPKLSGAGVHDSAQRLAHFISILAIAGLNTSAIDKQVWIVVASCLAGKQPTKWHGRSGCSRHAMWGWSRSGKRSQSGEAPKRMGWSVHHGCRSCEAWCRRACPECVRHAAEHPRDILCQQHFSPYGYPLQFLSDITWMRSQRPRSLGLL